MSPSSSVVWGAEPVQFLTKVGRNATADIVGFRHADTGARQTARGPHVLGGGHAGGDGRDRHLRCGVAVDRAFVGAGFGRRAPGVDRGSGRERQPRRGDRWLDVDRAARHRGALVCLAAPRAQQPPGVQPLRPEVHTGMGRGLVVHPVREPLEALGRHVGALESQRTHRRSPRLVACQGLVGAGAVVGVLDRREPPGCRGERDAAGKRSRAPWHRATSSRWSRAWWRSRPPSARS